MKLALDGSRWCAWCKDAHRGNCQGVLKALDDPLTRANFDSIRIGSLEQIVAALIRELEELRTKVAP